MRQSIFSILSRACALAAGLLLQSGVVSAAPAPIRRGPLVNGPSAPAARPASVPSRPAAAKPVSRPADRPAARPSAPSQRRSTSAKKAPPSPPPPAGSGLGPMAPYRGAIAVDADTGRVLFTDHAQNKGRPASVTKLMTYLLVLEDLHAGRYTVNHRVTGSPLAASMEPSKVDLRPGQTMTVGDLLLSIMVKSANDAAEALAEHAAYVRSGGAPGTPPPPGVKPEALRDAFVARMNRRAQELGMASTRYASPNGLPPPPRSRREWDVSTAADLVKLARALVRIPGALEYTSQAGCSVIDGSGKKTPLQNHNYFIPRNRDPRGLCTPVEGCDGLKTGFTAASGSSIILTAQRRGHRVIVVVLGSAGRHEREAAAGRLLRDALDAVSIW